MILKKTKICRIFAFITKNFNTVEDTLENNFVLRKKRINLTTEGYTKIVCATQFLAQNSLVIKQHNIRHYKLGLRRLKS